ncbi:hypothetical protein V5R04_14805 [Jonesiaceae bacterium BS-20]|uniref:Uncharacterized protein n=1 Tax=Jonesiaceae bacterium BS-20 TaxID=3120821 RepID=A0AAU7DUV5_9MICO
MLTMVALALGATEASIEAGGLESRTEVDLSTVNWTSYMVGCMPTDKTANVVLLESVTLAELKNRDLYSRLLWVGGTVTLSPTAIIFRANRVNRAMNRQMEIHELHSEFGMSLRQATQVKVRSWLGIKAIFIHATGDQWVMGIRCFGAAKFAHLIQERCKSLQQ